MKNRAVIGLGSNIDPNKNIAKAKQALEKHFGVAGQSRFLVTKPVGKIKQADFVNGAVAIETDLSLDELKNQLKELETALGRKPSVEKYGPREIDLDILVWNDAVIDKHFYERDFLKNSVLELIPNLKY